MKKAAALLFAIIMIAIMCTGCFAFDPLVISHKYAGKLAGTWSDDGKNIIRVGLDDDTIGYINYTTTPDDSFSYRSIGDWRMEKTTLSLTWHSAVLFDQAESGEDIHMKITYTYANGLNDDIIEQGKDAIQNVYNKRQEAHQWYASDKYLCLDDLIFTRYKD